MNTEVDVTVRTYTVDGCDCDCDLICKAALADEGGACPRRYVDLATRMPLEERPTAQAARLVDGDRRDAYGHALDNHERIAAFFTVRLFEKLRPGTVIEPHEAAALMRLVKEARLIETPGHADSFVDIAGYADVEHEIHMTYGRRRSPMRRFFAALRGTHDTSEGR